MPLAVSSAKKSITVQTNKQTQIVNDISTPCLSTCVDNKVDNDAFASAAPVTIIIIIIIIIIITKFVQHKNSSMLDSEALVSLGGEMD